MLLRNVRLVGDPDLSREPVDLLLENGRVSAVLARDVEALGAESAIEILDAEGRFAIPGLWDNHVHFGQVAMNRSRIDLRSTQSADDVLRAVADSQRDRDVLIGVGYRSAVWPAPASVAALDQVTGSTPTILISGDAHNGWLNSAALRAAGLGARDSCIEEREWFDLLARLPGVFGLRPTIADYRQAVADAHARGVVGIVDLEFERGFELWPDRVAHGLDNLRVRVGTYPADLDVLIASGLRTGDSLGGLAVVGPLKLILDGSLNTRTAYCCAPYAASDERGVRNYSTDELDRIIAAGAAHGLDVAVHAIGDQALDEALDSIARCGATGTIEHAQLANWAAIRRLAGLGIAASVQPAHLLDDRDVANVCWADRTDRCFAFRAMLDAGVDLRLGSDAPVSPLDPWEAMRSAVHRSAYGDEPWHPEQAISPVEALWASTDGNRLQIGDLADVVLLDHDPIEALADPSRTAGQLAAAVCATIVAGSLTPSSA